MRVMDTTSGRSASVPRAVFDALTLDHQYPFKPDADGQPVVKLPSAAFDLVISQLAAARAAHTKHRRARKQRRQAVNRGRS